MHGADAIALLQGALVVVGALTLLLWAIPSPCRCESCAFHVNERRMAALKQAELNHDYAHEHGMHCGDASCPRNPKGVE